MVDATITPKKPPSIIANHCAHVHILTKTVEDEYIIKNVAGLRSKEILVLTKKHMSMIYENVTLKAKDNS